MKIAKLFQNGRSQAVRLLKEFRFKGQPVKQPLLDSLHKFSKDFMATREQPEIQRREDVF